MHLPADGRPDPDDDPVDADVETASDGYALRFAGAVGAWFLRLQAELTLELLADLPRGAVLLDVGGGHAQLLPWLLAAGYRVTVLASSPAACGTQLRQYLDAGRCALRVGNLRHFPLPSREFHAVLCFRLLGHTSHWRDVLGEMCRVSERAVVLDYATSRSLNVLSHRLFGLKRTADPGHTRTFRVFDPVELEAEFLGRGFRPVGERQQYVLPMVLHRLHRSAGTGRALEAAGRRLGLTQRWGSPVIVRADRLDVA